MAALDDGFSYPVLDRDRCLQCGKCVAVCPIHQSRLETPKPQTSHCYFGWHDNAALRKDSTSGGAFTAIAESVLRQGRGAVYGALYGDDWTVVQRASETLNGVSRLRQSKYVQSDMGDCYSGIEGRLRTGESILFCGTPCQVDAVRRYLGKPYERLLLVDLICHGVTSPALFKLYIKALERQEGACVARVRFRDKVTKGNVASLAHTTIDFENGRTKSSEWNLYLRAYMHGLLQRVCCEKCPYARRERRSDITIGDFWGIERLVPSLKDEFHGGISLILSNTEKGFNVCGKLSQTMHITETDVTNAFNGRNAQLMRPVLPNARKGRVYSDAQRFGVYWAMARAIGAWPLIMIAFRLGSNTLKAHLPRGVYRRMQSLKRALC